MQLSATMVALFAVAAGVRAQAPPLAPFVPVDDASVVAVAMVWRHGLDDDATTHPGLCRVLLQCRLRRARAAVPELLASGGDVDGSTSLAWAVCDRTAAAAAIRFLQVLAADTVPLAADDFAIARARAALLADDEAFVLPGTMLQAAARRQWWAGTPAAVVGDGREPAAILALDQDRVQVALQQERPRRTAGLGAFDAAFAAAAATSERGGTTEVWVGAAKAVPDLGSVTVPAVEHTRLDGPVVAVACPIGAAERAPLAVAVQIARARAERRWKPRAAEGAARIPFVGWDWLHDEPCVLFHRRGYDQRKLLPGERSVDAVAEAAATRAEIEALLADLRQVPVRPDEVAAAISALARTFGHDGAKVVAGDPRAAAVWLAARLRAAVRGIEPSRLSAVTQTEAQAALRAMAAAGAASWHVLSPRAHPDYGFDRR